MIHDKPRHGLMKYGGVCSFRFGISCILYPTDVHKTCLHFIYGAPLKVLKSMQNIVVVIIVQTTYQLSANNLTICWSMKEEKEEALMSRHIQKVPGQEIKGERLNSRASR